MISPGNCVDEISSSFLRPSNCTIWYRNLGVIMRYWALSRAYRSLDRFDDARAVIQESFGYLGSTPEIGPRRAEQELVNARISR